MTINDPLLALVAEHEELRRRYEAQDHECDRRKALIPASVDERASVCLSYYRDETAGCEDSPISHLFFSEDVLAAQRDRLIAFNPHNREGLLIPITAKDMRASTIRTSRR